MTLVWICERNSGGGGGGGSSGGGIVSVDSNMGDTYIASVFAYDMHCMPIQYAYYYVCFKNAYHTEFPWMVLF